MSKLLIVLFAACALFGATGAWADWPGDHNNGGGNDPPHQTPARPDSRPG